MPRELDPKRACTPRPAGRTAPHPAVVFPPTLPYPRKGWSPTTNPVHVCLGTRRVTPRHLPTRCPSPGARTLARLNPQAALARLQTLLLCRTIPLRAATWTAGVRPAACCPASFLGARARSRALPLVPIQHQGPLTPRLMMHPCVSLCSQPGRGRTPRRS